MILIIRSIRIPQRVNYFFGYKQNTVEKFHIDPQASIDQIYQLIDVWKYLTIWSLYFFSKHWDNLHFSPRHFIYRTFFQVNMFHLIFCNGFRSQWDRRMWICWPIIPLCFGRRSKSKSYITYPNKNTAYLHVKKH